MLYRPGQAGSGQAISLGAVHIDQIITNAAPLPFPLDARLNSTGESVTLLQTCNWQGHSPADIAVDNQGRQFLATFDEVTIVDGRVVPNGTIDQFRARPAA